MKMSVVLIGVLRGMSLEGECEVLATRYDEHGTTEFYSDLRILTAPSGWPDGAYLAEFAGWCARVSRRDGAWAIEPSAHRAPHGCDDASAEVTAG